MHDLADLTVSIHNLSITHAMKRYIISEIRALSDELSVCTIQTFEAFESSTSNSDSRTNEQCHSAQPHTFTLKFRTGFWILEPAKIVIQC